MTTIDTSKETLTKEELLQCLRSVRVWLEYVEFAVANCESDKFPRMPQMQPTSRVFVPCPKGDTSACS
jgi:hypothetical protein